MPRSLKGHREEQVKLDVVPLALTTATCGLQVGSSYSVRALLPGRPANGDGTD